MPTTEPTTQPTATDIDPATAEPEYWLDQPAIASVPGRNYDAIIAGCDHVLRQRFFEVDRVDYRSGQVTSKPLVSKQFWEFWRSDVEGWRQVRDSSVATYRRSVYWTVTKADDGTYCASPKVIVERMGGQPKRVTTVVYYRRSLASADHSTRITSPKLADVPVNDWYALGRDAVLEQSLAEDLTERLAH